MGKILITKQKNNLLLALYENKKPDLFSVAPLLCENGILGNIYLAKVKDIAHGINAAFLSISPDETVYLPLKDNASFLCANRILSKEDTLRQGDEIIIQIAGEALKTKQPTATTKLTLTGQYVVCTYKGHGLSFSKKIKPEKREQLDTIIRQMEIAGRKKYHFTIRTNAENLEDYQPLLEEMTTFIKIFDTLTETYKHRMVYHCFYKAETEILKNIQGIPLFAYDEIITDEKSVYELLQNSFIEKKVRFYQDEMLSLSKLYSLDTHIEQALAKKVWLSGGGYLVIEPTEAMVVIDVNSGKAESKAKKSKDYYLKINLEAAKEVARQLRIRNYSGMIMVDFINMESEEDNHKLMTALDAYLKEDKVRTRLIDMTALGIIEITRKKVSKPLGDFF